MIGKYVYQHWGGVPKHAAVTAVYLPVVCQLSGHHLSGSCGRSTGLLGVVGEDSNRLMRNQGVANTEEV